MIQLHNFIKKHLFFLLFVLILTNCGTKHFYEKVEKKIKCIDKIYFKTKETIDYKDVMSQFKDTLNFWTERKLKLYEFSDKKNYFIDDVVYFNKQKNQCVIILVSSVFLNKEYYLGADKYIGGEKINGKWHFYYFKMLSNMYEKKASTKDSLLLNVRSAIIENGYIKWWSCGCKINQKFFNSLIINDEFREGHKLFLDRLNP